MKTVHFILALALIVFSSSTVLTASVADSGGVSYAQLHSAQFIGYAPAKLEITFPHTTTVQSNVSSLSGGRYTYNEVTSSPYSTMSFFLNASDIYTIYFVIRYPGPTSGNLTWTMLSPGFLPQSGMAYINGSSAVALTFTAELLNEQLFPTSNEIANATVGLLLSRINSQNAYQQQELQAMQSSLRFQNELDTAVISTSLLVSIVSIILARRFVAPR